MKENYSTISKVISLIALTILCIAPYWSQGQSYCTPQYTYIDCSKLQRSVYITSVAFSNRQYYTGCSQAGYAGIVNTLASGGQDPIVLTNNQYYSLRVTGYDYNSATYAYSSSVNYSVWIDYDRNGTFDPSELVLTTNTANGPQSIYFSESVAGNMRMRIRTRSTNTNNDPCASQDIGETEDYLLQVRPAAPVVVNTYNSICSGSSASLTASGCNYGTINWSDGKSDQRTGRTVTVSPNLNSTYTATCTQNGVNSLASESIYLYVYTSLPPTISSNNYNLTLSQPAQTAVLTAASCYGVMKIYSSDDPLNALATYYTGPNGGFAVGTTVTPQHDTRYWATCAAYYTNNCTSDRSNEILVRVNAPNAPVALASKQSICPKESSVLSASNCAGTVLWSSIDKGISTSITTANSITVSPGQTTEYNAICNINGTASKPISLTVSVSTPVTITAQPIPLTVCEGTPVSLGVSATGSGSLLYRWSRNGVAIPDSFAVAPQLIYPTASTALNGDYVVSVTGVCGVVSSASTKLLVSPKITALATATPVSCPGSTNGTISVATQGGINPIQYQISDRAGQSQGVTSFTGLSAGIYPITIRDAANCSTTASATVTQPAPITFAVSSTPSNCVGTKDGALIVIAGGGTGAFQYQIGSDPFQPTGAFGTLTGGVNYTVTAQDANGCKSIVSATVQQPAPITATIITIPTLCSGKTGALLVTASGGTGAKQYRLNMGDYQAGNSFSSLAAGTYTVTVKDEKGCESAAIGLTISTTTATQFTVSATATDVNCYGDKSGTVKVTVSGGTGPLQYQLGTGNYQSGDSFTGVAASTYLVNVKDANGCVISTNISVNQPPALTIKTVSTQVNCFGDRSGTVTVTSSGGTGDRQYQLNFGAFQNENIFRNLNVGVGLVIARDAKGCTVSDSIKVTKADSVKASVVMLQASCCTCPNGTLTITSSGGVGIKQAQLGTGSFQELLQFGSLAPGTYKITVKDQDGCTTTLNPVVTSASNLSLTFGSVTNVTCAGGRDGSAGVTIITGRSPYKYVWSNGDTTAVATKLPEGEIRLTLTDADKCIVTAKTSLTALNPLPPKPVVTLTAAGLSTSATSGIQWYSGTTNTSGTAVQGATQPIYVPGKSGNYYVITTVNTCQSPASDIFNYILTGLFEAVPTLEIRPYPNPATSRLYVEVKNPEYSSVRLQFVDLNGKTHHSQDSFPFEGRQVIELNVSALTSGLYLLHADTGSRKVTAKVIVH